MIVFVFKNLFIIGGYILLYISRYCRTKKWMMLFNSFSSISFCAGYILFGAYTAAISSIIAVLRGLAVNYKDKKQVSAHWLYVIFLITTISITIFTWSGPNTALVPVFIVINLTAIWYLKSEQKIRIFATVASVVYIMYQVTIKNYIGAILEITVAISSITSYLKYRNKELCRS